MPKQKRGHTVLRIVRCAAVVALVLLVLLATAVACAPPDGAGSGPHEDSIEVWVSIVPQKYFVERLGGSRVHVEVMVPPGFSPATYEPKPSQIEGLTGADLYIRIRVPFEEAWMSRFSAASDSMLVVDQSQGIERLGGQDPHIWLSPRLVKVQVQTICDGLVEVDPAHENLYRANLDTFLAELDELDAYIEQTLAGWENRKFVVFHPAWSYFASDYDLEMIAVQIEGSDPSPAEMVELIHIARSNGIKVIFAQPEFSTQSAEVIAQEIGGEVLLISPLAADWMDNLERVADTFAKVLGEQG